MHKYYILIYVYSNRGNPPGEEENMKHVISYSGGKDSTAMVVRMVE